MLSHPVAAGGSLDTDDSDLDRELELLLQEETSPVVVSVPVQVNRLPAVVVAPVVVVEDQKPSVAVIEEDEPEAALV